MMPEFPTHMEFDYVIVGAGSAGCVLANRLSADAGVRVAVLEAGGWDRNLWLRLPVGYFKTIYDERFSRLFATEPGEGTAGRSITWPRGRIVGGSSSINGLLYIRGQREDYDDWASKGASGWDYRSVLPYSALGRPNLTVLPRVHVNRIVFDGVRAVGVECRRAGSSSTELIRCTREVILAAGTIQSPQILQLSGIGPSDLLRRHGVDVLVEAPEVGENLKDHYQARTIVRLKERMSLNDDVRNPIKVMAMGLDWLLRHRGPLTVGAGQVGGFAKTPYAEDGRADMQFNVMPLSVDKPGDPLHDYSGFTASACQCRPLSRGRIAIRSTDPLASPRIEANYLAEPLDRKTLVAGIRMLREIYAQRAFRGLIAGEVLPGKDRQTDDDLLDFARAAGGTVFHPIGTCRMGSDERAVVDPQLRVRGVVGLRVIDASIMPDMISCNTNAASIMIGEKGAALVKGDSATPNYGA
jgi:choline dehydrogenase-like flavoprotein